MSPGKKLSIVIISLIYLTNFVSAECQHGELYPNPFDCQLFYHCSYGILYELSCPAGLFFSPNISVCDFPSNVNCAVVTDLPTSPNSTTSTTPNITTSTSSTTTTTTTTTTTSTPTTPLSRCTDFCGRYVGSMHVCPQFDLGMQWSSAGTIPGKHCTQIIETADPHTWTDNYLCFNREYGIRWSSAGTIAGMNCARILEVADPHTWDDNFLCVPHGSPFQFRWSSAGSIADLCCVQMYEPADPHTWNDNFICVSE